jgi:hypothetical protein
LAHYLCMTISMEVVTTIYSLTTKFNTELSFITIILPIIMNYKPSHDNPFHSGIHIPTLQHV